jgi:hypothetical protein
MSSCNRDCTVPHAMTLMSISEVEVATPLALVRPPERFAGRANPLLEAHLPARWLVAEQLFLLEAPQLFLSQDDIVDQAAQEAHGKQGKPPIDMDDR